MTRRILFNGITVFICISLSFSGCKKAPIEKITKKPVKKNKTIPTTISVKPENAIIVVPSKIEGNPKQVSRLTKLYKVASEELQKHFKLITGSDIPIVDDGNVPPGKYPFYIGIIPADDKKPIVSQESRWVITPKGACFYGDTEGYGTGAQYAIYAFLETQLGIHWVEPGDQGIVFKKQSPLVLKFGNFNWIPKLMFRAIRQAYRIDKRKTRTIPSSLIPFKELYPTIAENNKKAEEDILWKKRMRMGGSRPGGGHSFTKWWDKYGKTHPEYFALNKFGKREPVEARKTEQTNEFVKICPSNPEVAEQIVADWLPLKARRKYVGALLNDGNNNFCECENCKKLDVLLKGEKFGEHVTDRYVYLANSVAKKVKKHRPDACVAMYAYLASIWPPRKLKVEPNVVVQVVPYVIPLDLDVTEEVIGGWQRAGAKMIAFRPNYHTKYHPFPLPLGIEKQMFDVFQLAVKNGCISADYDSLVGNWDLTGMADYVLAKSMAEPDKPFEHWEEQYCSAYGAAAEDAKKYFRYWREEVWEKRLKPNLKKIATTGRHGNFARGLAWAIHSHYIRSFKPEGCNEYYNEKDFDITDKILLQAASRDLTPEQKKRVEQLILINQHSRLEFGAMYYRGSKGYEYSKKLLAFRKKYRSVLNVNWLSFLYCERVWGDICNLRLAKYLEKYPLPWIKTPFKWRFKMDPKNVGLKEKWQEKNWEETKDWKPIRVNVHWSNTYESPHIELKKKLKDYDGIGWYSFRIQTPDEMKGRKILLYFGGVDDSCWVYVNGKFAGKHISKKPADKNAPFEIKIDPFIKWDAETQHIMVRVEDLGGKGGVHKETWIVSKKSEQ